MTGKELLYVEDALGHEQYFLQKCAETASNVSDPALKTCIDAMSGKHRQIYKSFYGLL